MVRVGSLQAMIIRSWSNLCGTWISWKRQNQHRNSERTLTTERSPKILARDYGPQTNGFCSRNFSDAESAKAVHGSEETHLFHLHLAARTAPDSYAEPVQTIFGSRLWN